LAELSSYEITTDRYGEMRQAQGVLIFVYEEINGDTRIKVESDKTPPAKQVPVLKLNNVVKFNTGVYDYSVMTSVFSGLSGPGVKRFLEPRKISLTAQEWCGHVYHHLIPRSKGLESEIHSYFEAEGDATTLLPYPSDRVYYEDELPILIRELDGEFLKTGESKTLDAVPSLWKTRKRHKPLAFSKGLLTKAGPAQLSTRSGEKATIKWTFEQGGEITTYYVEAAHPRKLLAGEDGKGEKGELVRSLRKTYWKLNRNQDEGLRRELGLTFGVGAGS
jgi:hypothetical protein